MNMKMILPLTCLCGFLAGCASAPNPSDARYGFTESAVSADTFRISFRPGKSSTRQQTEDFAMLKAADICLAHHFPCFAVVDETSTTNFYTYISPAHYYSQGTLYGDGFLPNGMMNYTAEQTETTARPRTTLTVRGFSSKPANPPTFDAASLEATVKSKYHLP
jgi:hypothetical protein